MEDKKGVWSKEEKEYLASITPGHKWREIAQMMTDEFNLNYTMKQISAAIKRYKLNTGLTGQFEKGRIPKNKGLKGQCNKGCEKTWFKKGHKPKNWRPVGSERVNTDGYIEIKIAEPSKWELKHRVVWEEHHGKFEKGMAIIFADGDTTNTNIDNLIAVTRRQLAVMNGRKLNGFNAESKRTGVLISELIIAISDKKGRSKNEKL